MPTPANGLSRNIFRRGTIFRQQQFRVWLFRHARLASWLEIRFGRPDRLLRQRKFRPGGLIQSANRLRLRRLLLAEPPDCSGDNFMTAKVCAHRGELLPLQSRGGCCGDDQVTVYRCRLYGQCSLQSWVPVPYCPTCRQFREQKSVKSK